MKRSELERRLSAAGIAEARHESLLIAEALTGKSAAILRFDDVELPDAADGICRRREAREPLQYILGEWDFMGFTFEVGPGVLSPRPETELLVEEALKHLPTGGSFADLCTGSGCIAASVALLRPDISVTAVELSTEASAIARRNFHRLGVDGRVTLIEGDVTEDIFADSGESFDVIASNPPYISAEEMLTLDAELAYEPEMALTDGGDGLSVIRALIKHCPAHLKPGGRLLIEIGAGQGDAVREIAAGYDARVLRDYSGKERLLSLKR